MSAPRTRYGRTVKLEGRRPSAICMCNGCGKYFESFEPPEIVCGFCKEAALIIQAAEAKLPNGNLSQHIDRITRGAPAATQQGVRMRVLGDA